MNDDTWWENSNYNYWDEINYMRRVYDEKMSVILPSQKSIVKENKTLLRSIEI